MSYKVLCGVPTNECCGNVRPLAHGFAEGTKTHASHEEAFKCKKRYLLSHGYKQLDSRAFQINDEPVLVLTKKSRFGGHVRRGKGMQGGTGSRFMSPRARTGGMIF